MQPGGGSVRSRLILIYDTIKHKKISFEIEEIHACENFLYDPESGTLIVQCGNTFYGQRRNQSGDFEIVYEISPRHADMEFDVLCGAADGGLFFIQNGKDGEIYRILDGELQYVLLDGEYSDIECYGLLKGQLCSFQYTGEEGLLSCPLLDTKESREKAREFLTYEDTVRTLHEEERKQYYILKE